MEKYNNTKIRSTFNYLSIITIIQNQKFYNVLFSIAPVKISNIKINNTLKYALIL